MRRVIGASGNRGEYRLYLAVVSAIALSACGASQSSTSTAPDVDSSTSTPETSDQDEAETKTKRIDGFTVNFYGSTRVDEGKVVKVDAGDDYFAPTVFTGAAGSRIALVLTNSGQSIHSFTSDELKIDEDIEVGKSVKVAVTFPKNGRVIFICRYHEFGGMVGALEVR